MKKYIFIAALLLISLGCSGQGENGAKESADPTVGQTTQSQTGTNSILLGEWLKPIEGQEGKSDGIRLNADGSAESINAATLVYKSWQSDGESITLTAISIGNGVSSDFALTYQIEELSDGKLVLKLGENIYTYTKAN